MDAQKNIYNLKGKIICGHYTVFGGLIEYIFPSDIVNIEHKDDHLEATLECALHKSTEHLYYRLISRFAKKHGVEIKSFYCRPLTIPERVLGAIKNHRLAPLLEEYEVCYITVRAPNYRAIENTFGFTTDALALHAEEKWAAHQKS